MYPQYAVIMCDERDYWRYVMEVTFFGLFISDNGTRDWAFYKAFDLEVPSKKELKHLKGLIITSSKYSMCDVETVPWIRPLIAIVKSAYEEYPEIKMLGTGFGS